MSTPGGPAVQPGMLSASQLTWKLIFINYCLKLLCWVLKLARFANNYAVLMMFSALFGSHQQSAIFGCCAGFVWKWHPSLQQTLTRWKLFKGTCKHQFPPSKVCFFQKCAAVYHQLMPHMVRALIWFDSCFRVERCELGQTLQPARAVVASDYPWTWWEKRGVCPSKVEEQQKQNSLEEGKLRQIGCSEIKILANLGGQWPWAERGKGWDDILNGKDAAQGIFLSYASTPVFSGASMPGWPWSTGLWVSPSCTPGVRMTAKKVVGEW